MSIRLDLPGNLEDEPRVELGDLDRAAKEALLIQSYREGRLSIGQVAIVLDRGVVETQAWLSEKGVSLNHSVDDLDEDRRTLAELLSESD